MGDGVVKGRIGLPGRDVAIDLGTLNTMIFARGRGIVYEEPTVAAVGAGTGEVVGVGEETWQIVHRSQGEVTAVRPLRRGVIVDFELTRRMLRRVFRRLGLSRVQRPRAVVTIPTGLTSVERRAAQEAVKMAGARSVTLIEKPLAAAIGAGLPIQEPVGNLVVDVGGATTEAAIVAMGGLITGAARPVGGQDVDAAIRRHVRARYDVVVGEATAERLKLTAASAYPVADAKPAEVQGRRASNGVPVTVVVTPTEIREATEGVVARIVDAARYCLAESPPELSHDVLERGVFLTGGGGLLRGLDMRLSQDCEVPVHVADRPAATVVLGAGRLLEHMPELQTALAGAAKWS